MRTMAIDKFPLEKIEELLRNSEIQKRIQAYQESIQTEALVTIGRAAKLFGFSETKLREWDRSGYLSSVRSRSGEQGGTGQRQYSVTELNKLAIIRVLQDAGVSEVPASVDELWREIVGEHKEERLTIDQHVEKVYKEEFWRFYASRAMQLSLALICGDALNAVAGLVIPLRQGGPAMPVLDAEKPEEFARLGPSLLCFLSENHVFHTFYEPVPSFEYLTDFRIRGLVSVEEDAPRDRIYVVLQRKMKPTLLDSATVNVIRRLLAPLYEQVTMQEWEEYLGHGFRDVVYPYIDFGSAGMTDTVLSNLMELIIQLGGKADDGNCLWKFCCMLLPNDSSLPLYQRSLVVRAKSLHSPHALGVMVHPQGSVVGLSIRAFQSGTIVLRRNIMRQGSDGATIALWESERTIRSAVAFPIGGEDGLPIGVVYVASEHPDAFSEDDLRVFRLIGRMAEDRLRVSGVQRQIYRKLSSVIANPVVVDSFLTIFTDILTEGQFRRDVEELLQDISMPQSRSTDGARASIVGFTKDHIQNMEGVSEEAVSFISVDVDQQGYLANVYGDLAVRNLNLEVGIKIKDTLKALAKEYADCHVYHIYADRFYIMLDGVSLERARKIAEQLRLALSGTYKLDALKMYPEQETPSGRLLEIPDITVRLGVTSYLFTKLAEILARYAPMNAIDEVEALIISGLDTPLNLARDDGGNAVFSWEPTIRNYVRWSPAKPGIP
jgi:GGDEF domain-containing protein